MAIDFTIVTAVTPDYWQRMKYAMPTWTRKPQFADKPLIVFHHGFTDLSILNPIKQHFHEAQFIEWDMPVYESVRELMLTAFIFGVARHVTTQWSVKLDCDTYFTDAQNVFDESDLEFDVTGHRWGYTKPKWWIHKLRGEKYYAGDNSSRIRHSRIASFCCLQNMRYIKNLATTLGGGLPIPSHDTVVWWYARESWKAKNIKALGVATNTNWKKIRAATEQKKTLVYTVGYGDEYLKFAMMCMHSLRDVGYKGDAVIFSDRDEENKYCRVINVGKLRDKEKLITGKRMSFHRRIGKHGNCPYDFFSIKYLPVDVIEKEDYDFILYVDSDILFTKNPTPIMNSDHILTDYHGWSVAKNMKALINEFDGNFRRDAEKVSSWSGAAIGVPKSMYTFYDKYRHWYLCFKDKIPHDQPALVLTLFDNRNEYKPERLPNRKYWRHYWGYRKAEMEAEYKRRFG